MVCIFGVSGALRVDEILKIDTDDIERHANLLLVRVLETKTKVARSFTVTGPFHDIVQKYANLRSPQTTHNRFLVNYQRGKCTVQPIGQNKIKKMPLRIAEYLQLPEKERYTGSYLV